MPGQKRFPGTAFDALRYIPCISKLQSVALQFGREGQLRRRIEQLEERVQAARPVEENVFIEMNEEASMRGEKSVKQSSGHGPIQINIGEQQVIVAG